MPAAIALLLPAPIAPLLPVLLPCCYLYPCPAIAYRYRLQLPCYIDGEVRRFMNLIKHVPKLKSLITVSRSRLIPCQDFVLFPTAI
jgi:hypothetical protein